MTKAVKTGRSEREGNAAVERSGLTRNSSLAGNTVSLTANRKYKDTKKRSSPVSVRLLGLKTCF